MNKKLLTVSLAMASICVAGCSTTPIESDSISSTETTVDITNADLPKGVTTYTAEDGTTKKEYTITASVGSAISVINEVIDFQSLMDRADEEMYADKKARKAALSSER